MNEQYQNAVELVDAWAFFVVFAQRLSIELVVPYQYNRRHSKLYHFKIDVHRKVQVLSDSVEVLAVVPSLH